MELCEMFQKLPQDVVKRILSLLDIDRRRALGVYTKIKVPFDIKNNLDFVLTNYRIKYVFDSYFKRIEKAILNLNSLYIIEHEWYTINSYDAIYNNDNTNSVLYSIKYNGYLHGNEHKWFV